MLTKVHTLAYVLCIRSHKLPPDTYQQTFNAYKSKQNKIFVKKFDRKTVWENFDTAYNLLLKLAKKNNPFLMLKISFVTNGKTVQFFVHPVKWSLRTENKIPS